MGGGEWREGVRRKIGGRVDRRVPGARPSKRRVGEPKSGGVGAGGEPASGEEHGR